MNILKEDYIFSKEDMMKFKNSSAIFLSDELNFDVDLSIFINIKQLRITCKKWFNLNELKNLKYLNISNLNTDKTTEIVELTKLERLDITRGNIQNLTFINGLKNLLHLELNYLTKLTDISSLCSVANSIQILDIDSCKKINTLQIISKLTNLKTLGFISMNLADISFLVPLNLSKFLAIDSNILSGDLSPALNIPWIAIDNKRHYNYKFDEKTKKLIPKVTKILKAKKTDESIIIEPFGLLRLNSLESYYEVNLEDENISVSLDMNYEQVSIKKSKLDIVKHITSFKPSNISAEMITFLKSVLNHESIVLYKEFLEDEFEEEYLIIEDFLDSLQLKRIGFYPESTDAVAIFDFQPAGLDLDHLLCLHMDSKNRIIDISVES